MVTVSGLGGGDERRLHRRGNGVDGGDSEIGPGTGGGGGGGGNGDGDVIGPGSGGYIVVVGGGGGGDDGGGGGGRRFPRHLIFIFWFRFSPWAPPPLTRGESAS